MEFPGGIDRSDLLEYAIPRLALGVPKTRVVRDYSRLRGVRLTRQNLDYHLSQYEKDPGYVTTEANDQPIEDDQHSRVGADSTSLTRSSQVGAMETNEQKTYSNRSSNTNQ